MHAPGRAKGGGMIPPPRKPRGEGGLALDERLAREAFSPTELKHLKSRLLTLQAQAVLSRGDAVVAANAAKKASGDPKKLVPRDKETADHSFHYCVAVALLDQACGEAQFTEEKLQSAAVRGLIERTGVEPNDALTALWPGSSGGGVTVRLRSGALFEKVYEYPPGHPKIGRAHV